MNYCGEYNTPMFYAQSDFLRGSKGDQGSPGQNYEITIASQQMNNYTLTSSAGSDTNPWSQLKSQDWISFMTSTFTINYDGMYEFNILTQMSDVSYSGGLTPGTATLITLQLYDKTNTQVLLSTVVPTSKDQYFTLSGICYIKAGTILSVRGRTLGPNSTIYYIKSTNKIFKYNTKVTTCNPMHPC